MTRIYFDGRDLEIVIRYDGIARVYPLASLAAALRLPTAVLRARIDALLKAGDDLSTGDLAYGPSRESSSCSIMMEEEPTEMVVVGPANHASPKENNSDPSNHTGVVQNQAMVATMVRCPRASPASSDRPLAPEAIARTLGDDANVTAITSLIADVPVSLVRAALDQALAVPGHRLRGPRAALFTAIVRRLVHEHAHAAPTPYARTETSTT